MSAPNATIDSESGNTVSTRLPPARSFLDLRGELHAPLERMPRPAAEGREQ